MTGICVVCDTSFTGKRSDKKTCSDRCRQALSRNWREAWSILEEKMLAMEKAGAAERLGTDSAFCEYALAVLSRREAAHPLYAPTRVKGKDYRGLKPGVHRQADMTGDQTDHFSVWGHIRECPLAPLDAIEAAGRSSDWTELEQIATGMLRQNREIIGWPDGNGYGSGKDAPDRARQLLSDDPVIR